MRNSMSESRDDHDDIVPNDDIDAEISANSFGSGLSRRSVSASRVRISLSRRFRPIGEAVFVENIANNPPDAPVPNENERRPQRNPAQNARRNCSMYETCVWIGRTVGVILLIGLILVGICLPVYTHFYPPTKGTPVSSSKILAEPDGEALDNPVQSGHGVDKPGTPASSSKIIAEPDCDIPVLSEVDKPEPCSQQELIGFLCLKSNINPVSQKSNTNVISPRSNATVSLKAHTKVISLLKINLDTQSIDEIELLRHE
eukprot:22302_1